MNGGYYVIEPWPDYIDVSCEFIEKYREFKQYSGHTVTVEENKIIFKLQNSTAVYEIIERDEIRDAMICRRIFAF